MNDLSTLLANKPKQSSENRRALIVDDDFDFAESLEDILESRSYQVSLARDKTSAIEIMAHIKPHIAYLDLRLGSENGIELVSELLAIDSSLICMVMTGHGSIDSAIHAIQLGASDYLTKPIFPEDLLLKTEKAFYKLELETRHEQIQRISKQTQQWYEAIFNAAGEAIVSTDMQGKIKSMNQVAKQLLLGSSNDYPYIQDLVAELDLTRLWTRPGKITKKEYSLLDASGTTVPVHITVSRGNVGDMERMIFIMRDITQQKEAELAIRRANEQLEKRVADRTKDLAQKNKELQTFSYSVSHDLRAPLRAINGFSAALLEDDGDRLSDTGRAELQRIIGAAARMEQLIDDLLRLSRLNEGQLKVARVKLSDLAHNIFKQHASSEPNRIVEYVVEKDISTMADPGLISVVFENLISNAWKFTRHQTNPRIEFGTTKNDSEPVYFIRDNGIGFDMKHVDKLFRTFSRLHDSLDYEGTGIGLATVKRIIHRHQGSIWAEAQPGQGACFYFTLLNSDRVST